MKKLYALSLAALMAAGAANAADVLSQAVNNKVSQEVSKVKVAAATKLDNAVRTMADGDIDTSIAALAGEYSWDFYNYLNGANGGQKKAAATITVKDAATGSVDINLASWVLSATYDETTCKLSIPTGQDLGYNEANQIQVYNYHRVWASDGRSAEYTDDPVVVTFDGASLIFRTIAGTGDYEGEEILADMIGIGNSSLGWFLMAGENEMAKKVPFSDQMPDGAWKSIGTGVFTDGWQVSYFFGPEDYLMQDWEVEVEQNESTPYIYRIVNPYNVEDCPIYAYNSNPEGSGYIVFSVEDPEYVIAYPLIYSGLTDEGGAYLNFNMEGYYTILKGFSKETVIAAKVLENYSNYADGKVSFYNCRFGTTEEPEKAYYWDEELINVLSYLEITLPQSGVDMIQIDENSDAAVEYYNLQGVRVAEPANGLYIVRQGSKVSKQIIK